MDCSSVSMSSVARESLPQQVASSMDNPSSPSVVTYKKGEKRTRDLIPTVKEQDGGLLGRGVYGKVYIHGKDPKLAVKKSDHDLTDEFVVGHQLCHRCVTQAKQLFIKLYPNEGKKFKMVMERIEGMCIREVIGGKVPRLPPETIIPLIQDAKDTLGYLFDKKIAWVDLHDDNIYVTPRGQLKICDIGLWRVEPNALKRIEKLLIGALEIVKLTIDSSDRSFPIKEVEMIMKANDFFTLPTSLLVWLDNMYVFPRVVDSLPPLKWRVALESKLYDFDDKGKLSFVEHYLDRVIENFRKRIAT